MNAIDKAVKWIEELVNSSLPPVGKVSGILLYCTSIKRSGGSSFKTFGNMVNMMAENNFPTGKNEDGSDNMMNMFCYIISKCVFDMIHNDMVIKTVTPPGVKSVGYTSGGEAVTVVTTDYATGEGIGF